MEPTNDQLKTQLLTLAAKRGIVYADDPFASSVRFFWPDDHRVVDDKGLLTVCHLIELGMTEGEYEAFGQIICSAIDKLPTEFEKQKAVLSPDWPTRARAIIKILS